MPCYYPLRGFRQLFPNANGKFPLTGLKARSTQGVAPPGTLAVDVSCGRCIGCRLEYSRKWAIRCMHEASLHADNCMITLTYDDFFLPEFGSLDKSVFPLFMKRLRKFTNGGVRVYYCGEYGDIGRRPHYHALLFGYDFPDKVLWKESGDIRTYTSDILHSLWPFGFSTVGSVTFDSAAYVARYVVKKVTGDMAKEHYTRLVPETGELVEIQPEFVGMSRRPGIGREWFIRFSSDVYPDDFVVSRGHKVKPPRYYDSMFELLDPVTMEALRLSRIEKGYEARDNSTLDRLKVREVVARAKLSNLKRSLDNDT